MSFDQLLLGLPQHSSYTGSLRWTAGMRPTEGPYMLCGPPRASQRVRRDGSCLRFVALRLTREEQRVTTSLQESIQRFTADPGAGTITPTVTATLVNGQARLAAGPFNWDSDLPQAVGGRDESPSPTAYLL